MSDIRWLYELRVWHVILWVCTGALVGLWASTLWSAFHGGPILIDAVAVVILPFVALVTLSLVAQTWEQIVVYEA